MTNKNTFIAERAGILAASALLALLTLVVCMSSTSAQPNAVQGPAVAVVPPAVINQDSYDYFPAYETYYNRTSHEFVFRDGPAWVRRPEPRGITPEAMLAAPSVRMDFHDSPELHHDRVVKSYPKNWAPPAPRPEEKK